MKNIIRATAIATAMMGAAGSAHAIATMTIDGVTFPVGIFPGGNQTDTSTLAENPVTAPGDLDEGVGFVTAITQGLNTVWADGNNGVRLAYTFSYLTSGVIAPDPIGGTPGTVTFSSGTVNFYVIPAGTAITGYGSVAADMAVVQAGTLFAGTTAPKENPGGAVLISTIPANGSLLAFSGGTGQGFLDVTSGDAAAAFHTGTFANAFDTQTDFPGFSDMSFTSDFSSGGGGSTAPEFGIFGSSTLKANAVPEPVSLGVLGVGLLALGAVRRRRRG